MLEAVRENLKGTLMVVVVIIFIVPMVISGVGTTFMGGGASGGDAASVNGESITEIDLDRAIRIRQSQLRQQGNLDTSSPLLSEENLRGPVLDSLTRRMALVTEGKQNGLAMSNEAFGEALRAQSDFFTDGKFNQQRYNSLLAQNGLTSAGFKRELENDFVLRQQASGIQLSAFATETQFDQLVKLTHQKRSFFSVKIPLDDVEKNIQVSKEDIQAYYEKNSQEYEVPTKLKVDYLELSVEALAKTVDVSEDEILQQYEAETANFSAEASYNVAHILLEEANAGKATELAEKIGQGEDFAALAKEYSDDIATGESGGNLGFLTAGMFPEAFEKAVFEMEKGEVSAAVETDAGIHFIKVIDKVENEIPAFDDRREAILAELSNAKAVDNFAALVDTLGELTYFSDNLDDAAAELGLSIQQSSYFDRETGSGIADVSSVRNAAFDEKVMDLGHNSNTIELPGDRAIVLRLADKKEAYIRSLEDVQTLVDAQVTKQKIEEAMLLKSEEFIKAIQSGTQAESHAKDLSYEYNAYSNVTRTDFSVDREVLSMAFSASLPNEAPSIERRSALDGSYLIVAVNEVSPGKASDLSDVEKNGFLAQIQREFSNLDGSIYEASVFSSADVDI